MNRSVLLPKGLRAIRGDYCASELGRASPIRGRQTLTSSMDGDATGIVHASPSWLTIETSSSYSTRRLAGRTGVEAQKEAEGTLKEIVLHGGAFMPEPGPGSARFRA